METLVGASLTDQPSGQAGLCLYQCSLQTATALTALQNPKLRYLFRCWYLILRAEQFGNEVIREA
ncbi:hypothetical protein LZF95_00095 [Algoriphagus sp. AGSA1]|uniref:hypothetical protein n=1 Tax=Algoriphagus sp. AGSA1 TaxID=2907213 RepID=UPI001F4614B0|nr:hypothetical protein [Algoriphagus sp. AGSA1]MCE7053054.1 hypothetical protein [Algoriphagus sp. AGSA1]